ncbi:MAG: type IV secretion system DNA-binding domain-containing protein [Acidihalobacter sp.]|uniref:type IV secretory system conjugative DNA transfer family protein n=1 Tax=Acidihalobacter sp. TaxID=1872108 RepID=UPI00307DB204
MFGNAQEKIEYRRDWWQTLVSAFGGAMVGGFIGAALALLVEAHWVLHVPPQALFHAWVMAHAPELFHPEAYAQLLAQHAPNLDRILAVAAAGGALLLALAGGSLGGLVRDRQQEGGRRLLRGRDAMRAAQAEFAKEIKIFGFGQGAALHPQLPISRDRESRLVLIGGAPGGGKTQIIETMVEEILKADPHARILLHDIKGDFKQRLGALVHRGLIGKYDVGLVEPWDARSVRWSAAEDILSEVDAQEFASRLIPPPDKGDPSWQNGAANILAGLIISLARAKPGRWTWADLYRELSLPYPEFRARAIAGVADASLVLPEGEPNQNTMSYLSIITAQVGMLVRSLGAADRDLKGHRQWSARRWILREPNSGPRIMILGNSTRFESLARVMHNAIVSSMLAAIDQMPETRTRRTWLVLDEFPQLGRLDGIRHIVAVGRSKGICPVLTFQNISQIREIYGENFAKDLDGMARTVILCQTAGPDTQEWAASVVGKRQVMRQLRSASGDAALGGRSWTSTKNVTVSEHLDEEYLMRPDEFGELGRVPGGIEAVIVTGGRDVYRVKWKFSKWYEAAPQIVPAPWTVNLQPKTAARLEGRMRWKPGTANRAAQAAASVPTTTVRQDNGASKPDDSEPDRFIVQENQPAAQPKNNDTENAADAAGELVTKMAADHLTGGLSSLVELADTVTDGLRREGAGEVAPIRTGSIKRKRGDSRGR